MINLVYSTTIVNKILVSLSFKPLEERLSILSDLIGYDYLYSFEFLDMCLNSKTNDDLIEHIYLESYKDEEILKKNIGYINTEMYFMRESYHNNNSTFYGRDIRNTINDNLWELFKIAVENDKPFLVKLILNDERFEIPSESHQCQIFEYLRDKENPTEIIDILFLSERLSKTAKNIHIEELSRTDKFNILKYIIDNNTLFNNNNVVINKTTISRLVMRTAFYDNILAFSYLLEKEKLFKLINKEKVIDGAIMNNDSLECFTYLIEKKIVDLPNKYDVYSIFCIKTGAFQILTKILSYKYVSENVIFDILKPHMNSNNINELIVSFITSGKVDIYRDDYYIFSKFAKDITKNTLKIILQYTDFKSDDASKKVIRKTIFNSDPIDKELVYDYIANVGFDDKDYVASEAIIASKTEYIDKLRLLYPKYKFPDDIYYIQILAQSRYDTIKYCIDKSLFNIKKWSHYIIVKLLEKTRSEDSLLVMKHKKSVIKDETITYINKYIDRNGQLSENFIKDVKMAIRTKKIADILS